jgi:hypothetical protein
MSEVLAPTLTHHAGCQRVHLTRYRQFSILEANTRAGFCNENKDPGRSPEMKCVNDEKVNPRAEAALPFPINETQVTTKRAMIAVRSM